MYRDQEQGTIQKARRREMTDDELLTAILRRGRPMDPMMYDELTQRGLHDRFAQLERSSVGQFPHQLQ